MSARVAGIGTALPEKVVTNDDLAQHMETSDAWIRERSGIGERRVGGSTVDMAVEAATAAIAAADLTPGDIGFLVLCTTTPKKTFPASSAMVAAGLGITCGAMDLNVVCAGFPYGYVAAYGMMTTPGGPDRVLVIGSDAMSTIVDWTDRSTAILFGDGAGAVVLEKSPQGELLGQDFGVNGDLESILYCDLDDTIVMEGREVFKRAVRAVTGSVENALAQAGISAEDIDVVLPHQANIRIIEATAKYAGLPMEKVFVNVGKYGNMSSATVPIAFHEARIEGLIGEGSNVLTVAFGAGLTWGAMTIRM